jgi:hypothetical protein
VEIGSLGQFNVGTNMANLVAKEMACPEGWMSAFDRKADVGKLQFVASKQTFNFDDDQDRNAAKPVVGFDAVSDSYGQIPNVQISRQQSVNVKLRG